MYLRGAIPVDVCEDLIAHFEDHHYGYTVIPTLGVERQISPPPAWYHERIGSLLQAVAHRFGLPFRTGTASIVEYLPGDEFPPHTDAGERLEKSLSRTVSFTAMLSKSTDFDGGRLLFDGEDPNLERGDLAGFTARTMHEVTEVTGGRRLVLIAFGEG